MIQNSNNQTDICPIHLSLNIGLTRHQPYQKLTAANRILKNYQMLTTEHERLFQYDWIRTLDYVAIDFDSIIFCNLIRKVPLYMNTPIDPYILKNELSILCTTAKKLLDFVTQKFEHNNEFEKEMNYPTGRTSIKKRCAEIEAFAIEMLHHVVINDEFTNEKLVTIAHNESNFKVFPKELIKIITQNMFDTKLNETLKSFDTTYDAVRLGKILAKVEKPYIGIKSQIQVCYHAFNSTLFTNSATSVRRKPKRKKIH